MDWGSRRKLFGTSLGFGNIVQGCWLSDYWFLRDPASILHCPLFCICPHFSSDLAEILWTIFHKMVRDATSKTILGFLLVQLKCVGKTDDIAAQLICSTNPTLGFWVFLLRRLNLFFPFLLYTQVPISSNAFHCGRLSCECRITLQLPRGKQVPQCLWLGYLQL